MNISLFLSGLVGAICGFVYWATGAGWLEVGLAYVVSGMTSFVVLALMGTFKSVLGPSESETREIYADLLALEELLRTSERNGAAESETVQRARRLQRQLQSSLPRSTFGG